MAASVTTSDALSVTPCRRGFARTWLGLSHTKCCLAHHVLMLTEILTAACIVCRQPLLPGRRQCRQPVAAGLTICSSASSSQQQPQRLMTLLWCVIYGVGWGVLLSILRWQLCSVPSLMRMLL